MSPVLVKGIKDWAVSLAQSSPLYLYKELTELSSSYQGLKKRIKLCFFEFLPL